MRRKQLLTYGLLGVGAYLVYKHLQATAVPAVAVPAATGTAGFGYFPSGADRPFAQAYLGPGAPNVDGPFARYHHGVRWYR